MSLVPSNSLNMKNLGKNPKVKSMKQSLYGDVNQESFDYYIRTRQACNMVYENDKFGSVKSNAENQLVIQEMKQTEYL